MSAEPILRSDHPAIRSSNASDAELAACLVRYVDAVLAQGGDGRVWDRTMRIVEDTLIHRSLSLSGGVQLRAATLLGIHRNTMRIKLSSARRAL